MLSKFSQLKKLELSNELIYRYKKLFGDLVIEVPKNAVYHLIMKLPPEEVPESSR